MCPPACNSGVPVRVWAVRRDVPLSLVPRIVGSNPDPKEDGNCLVGVYLISFLLDFLGYAFLGLPCKVINQSIVGLSSLSETA
jgi:hypothetical protein